MKKCKHLLLIIILILVSCKKEEKKEIISNPQVDYPVFDNFLFFKKGMNYDKVGNLLKNKGIHFYEVDVEDSYSANVLGYCIPFRYLLLSNRIKVIEGNNLDVLNNKIADFQIIFIDNKIIGFLYFSEIRIFNDVVKDSYPYHIKITKDLELLETLGNALTEKYGYPQEKRGNLNAFNPTSEVWFKNSNYGHEEVSYCENSKWINKGESVTIELMNYLLRDKITTEFHTFTHIIVVFDDKLVRKLKKDSYIFETKRDKKIKDSIDLKNKKNREKQLKEL